MVEAECIRTCSLDRYYREGQTYLVDETNKYVKAYFKLPKEEAKEAIAADEEEAPKKRTRKAK